MQLKSFKKATDQIGKDISRGVNAASKEINKAVHGSVVVVSRNMLPWIQDCLVTSLLLWK